MKSGFFGNAKKSFMEIDTYLEQLSTRRHTGSSQKDFVKYGLKYAIKRKINKW